VSLGTKSSIAASSVPISARSGLRLGDPFRTCGVKAAHPWNGSPRRIGASLKPDGGLIKQSLTEIGPLPFDVSFR
jgi:hypothetical protein